MNHNSNRLNTTAQARISNNTFSFLWWCHIEAFPTFESDTSHKTQLCTGHITVTAYFGKSGFMRFNILFCRQLIFISTFKSDSKSTTGFSDLSHRSKTVCYCVLQVFLSIQPLTVNLRYWNYATWITNVGSMRWLFAYLS